MPEKKTAAIIPARGGSKRITRKNIRPFRGVPIIARTIATLQAARVFDAIYVSTEDDEIASTAREAGALTPFVRPDGLADDHTGTEEVIRHAITAVESIEPTRLDMVCAVYATAVLLDPTDLILARNVLVDDHREFVFAATEFPYPIQRALRKHPDGSCEMFQPEHLMTRSQDLEPAYHDAGQFYWGTRDAWLAGTPIFEANSAFHLLPRKRTQDIDTLEDWQWAERLHQLMEGGAG